MVLRALRHGGVDLGEGLHGAPERGDEGLPQEGMGRHDAVIGGEGEGGCEGLETRCDAFGIADMRRTAEGCEGGTAGEWCRREGRPATQDVAEARRVLLLQPVPPRRELVLEGTRPAMGAPHCVADHAMPVCDELGEGAQGGLCGWSGGSVSRGVRSRSSCSAASVGSSLARLGVKASRDRASLRGLIGKRASKADWRKAETRGPVVRSRQMATGWPWDRVRSVVPHASMASGVCASGKHAR
jgi:hypothetical protein